MKFIQFTFKAEKRNNLIFFLIKNLKETVLNKSMGENFIYMI